MCRATILLVLVITFLGCRNVDSNDVASSSEAKPGNRNEAIARLRSASDAGPSQQEKSEASAILQELRNIEHQGRSMQSLRGTTDQEKARQCAELMRRHQQAARDLIRRAERLAPRYGSMLVAAARELTTCVSCLANAIQNCEIAERTLSRAERVLK